MTEPPPTPNPPSPTDYRSPRPPAAGAGVPAWYAYVVGLLLLTLLATLLATTLVYRRRALVAEAQAARLFARQQTIGQFLSPALPTAQLPRAQVSLNGQPIEAIVVPAPLGERMGLAPGDVAIVAQPATTTAPQTAPEN